METTAIIVAAGMGSRMKAGRNKVFLELDGKTVLENTVKVFEECEVIDRITVVTGDIEECTRVLSDFEKVKSIVKGGATRQESVHCGLLASKGDIAVIHDGARALIQCGEIEAAVAACEKYGAAAVGVKCKDTLKQADGDGFIASTLEREFIYTIQTPQVFFFDEILKFHEQAEKNTFTDDCSIAESFGKKIKIVEGSYENIKLTTPDDMVLAEKILEKRRTEKCE